MSLLLHVIVTYIKENIITKLQKYTACPALFVKNLLCMGDLSPACKIFVERPEAPPPPPPHQILKSCPPLVLVSLFFVCLCYNKRTHPVLEKPGTQNTIACENQGKQRKWSDH